MNEIDPMGLLRAENQAQREELKKAGRYLEELVGRCRTLDRTVDEMAGHVVILLEKAGGSVVVTEADRANAAERVIRAYRTEDLEDNRERWFTMTPEEYEDQKRRQAAVDDAQKQGGVDPGGIALP